LIHEQEINNYINFSKYNKKEYALDDLRILVIENNHIQQNFIKYILKFLDFTNFVIAENGEEALSFYEQGAEFDVIFIATNIPNTTFCQTLNNIYTKTDQLGLERPFSIAVSENYSDDEIIYCKEQGFNSVIKKPYKKDKIQWILS
jgi:CheY-like chemotaxis protein